MIIKTFRAETSSAALKRVREEMGGDAIVLKTTQETGALGRIIYEVTACLENPTVGQTSKIFPDAKDIVQEPINTAPIVSSDKNSQEQLLTETVHEDIWKKRYEKLEFKINSFLDSDLKKEQRGSSPFDFVFEQLSDHDFSAEFINEFKTELEESYDASTDTIDIVKEKLTEKLNQFIVKDFSITTGDRLAFVGPAGSGKPSVMGKLAASLVMKEKKKVTLITLDDVKLGAYDETAAYAEILGTEYADNRSAIESSISTDTITLIDTVAIPNKIENIIPIKERLESIGTTHRIAVFSAIMRSKDVTAMKEQMAMIAPTHLVITKTDMTECLGTLITAAHSFGLKILYTTDSHGGVGRLNKPQTEELVNRILPIEVASE